MAFQLTRHASSTRRTHVSTLQSVLRHCSHVDADIHFCPRRAEPRNKCRKKCGRARWTPNYVCTLHPVGSTLHRLHTSILAVTASLIYMCYAPGGRKDLSSMVHG